jgi:hypothetical protein
VEGKQNLTRYNVGKKTLIFLMEFLGGGRGSRKRKIEYRKGRDECGRGEEGRRDEKEDKRIGEMSIVKDCGMWMRSSRVFRASKCQS